MNTLNLILSRRTIHSYSEESVPSEILENSIKAAIFAPNHKMTLPWTFYLAGPKTRNKFAELSIKLKSKKSPMTDIAKAAMVRKYENEGSLIVATIKRSDDESTFKEDYAAMSCAIQNIALYLHSEGYGSKWSTGGIISHEEAYRILNIDSAAEEISGFIWMGKARSQTPEPMRPDFETFLKKTE